MDVKAATRRKYTDADVARDARATAQNDEYQRSQEELRAKNMDRNRAGMKTETFRIAVPASFSPKAPIPPKRKPKE